MSIQKTVVPTVEKYDALTKNLESLLLSLMDGKLNGVGGKLDVGETPREAQTREFLEETGVLVKPERWLLFRVEKFTPEHTGQKLGAVVFFLFC